MWQSKLLEDLSIIAKRFVYVKFKDRVELVSEDPSSFGLHTVYFNPIELFLLSQNIKLTYFLDKNCDINNFNVFAATFGTSTTDKTFTKDDAEYLKSKREILLKIIKYVASKTLPPSETMEYIEYLFVPNVFEIDLSWSWCLMVNFIKSENQWVDFLEFCNEINIDLDTVNCDNLTQYFLKESIFFDIDPMNQREK